MVLYLFLFFGGGGCDANAATDDDDTEGDGDGEDEDDDGGGDGRFCCYVGGHAAVYGIYHADDKDDGDVNNRTSGIDDGT